MFGTLSLDIFAMTCLHILKCVHWEKYSRINRVLYEQRTLWSNHSHYKSCNNYLCQEYVEVPNRAHVFLLEFSFFRGISSKRFSIRSLRGLPKKLFFDQLELGNPWAQHWVLTNLRIFWQFFFSDFKFQILNVKPGF